MKQLISTVFAIYGLYKTKGVSDEYQEADFALPRSIRNTPNHRHLHQLILSISEDSIKCYESHLYFDSKSVFTILCWKYKHCKLRVWFLGILRQPTPESDDRQSRTS